MKVNPSSYPKSEGRRVEPWSLLEGGQPEGLQSADGEREREREKLKKHEQVERERKIKKERYFFLDIQREMYLK